MIRLWCPTRLARFAFLLIALAVLPTTAGAQEDGQPYPPDASVYGMKMPDWAAAWIQWRYSLPRSQNPDVLVDLTGLIVQNPNVPLP